MPPRGRLGRGVLRNLPQFRGLALHFKRRGDPGRMCSGLLLGGAVGREGEGTLGTAVPASGRRRTLGLGQGGGRACAHCRRGIDVADLLDRHRQRGELATAYAAALDHYAAPAETLADMRLAPFHLLATEGAVHSNRDHDATTWWETLTAAGGEGMVVKPWDFAPTEGENARQRLQPALKCRGKEYLRIICGPEYTAEENLARLRQRGLGTKRSLALREFALGIEGLERFVRREPLRRVHECAFGVLALESEPVDPRL